MSQYLINTSTLRREYTSSTLRRSDLTKEPIDLFNLWLKQALSVPLPDANAMTISTVDIHGQSYQRLVLLKYFDYQSMVFYTNTSSRKAIHLAYNPRISLHFYWNTLERQVLILGRAEQLSVTEATNYFRSRPRNSQIGAWVSQQSSVISSRRILESKFLELKQKFANGQIPLPNFWGGYRVIIDTIEFWQGGKNRLHDRFLYRRKMEGGWYIDRLAP